MVPNVNLLFVLTFACGMNAMAQTYPAKPLRMVVPLPPGATTDVVMRATAQELAPRIGQPIVVENHPGGNWVIGAQACLRAGPDAHSLCVVNSDTLSFNVHVLKQVPYDPARDFTPVTNLFFLLEGLIARGNLPTANAAQLQAYAKQKSGGANMATLGPGSSPDVFRQWLNQHWSTDLVGIPYKGGNQVVAAVLAGEVDVAKIGMGNLAGHLKSDKVKFLAIQGTRRSRLLPEVPTLTEVGLGGYSVRVWWGLMMNAGVPDAAARRINAEFNKLYREPKTAEYLENAFVEVAVGSPEEFGAFLTVDRQRAAEVVKQFNIPRN